MFKVLGIGVLAVYVVCYLSIRPDVDGIQDALLWAGAATAGVIALPILAVWLIWSFLKDFFGMTK